MANAWQIALAGALAGCGMARTAAAGPLPSRIVLHVSNQAGVTAADLGRAERIASWIYTDAGIQAIWRDDDGAISEVGETPRLWVIIVARDGSKNRIASGGDTDDVLGRAAHATRRAHVFYFAVIGAANRSSVPPSLVLGQVLAHEVGHLLLPEQSHSRAGIMCPKLDLGSTVLQRFTARQARAIAAALRSDRTLASNEPGRTP
jgi:hypothetical protein